MKQKRSLSKKKRKKEKKMLINKNALARYAKVLVKRVKWIELFVEYIQCAGMQILYLVFIILGLRLFINTTMLFFDIYL